MLNSIKSVLATINEDCAIIREIQEQHKCTKVYFIVLLYSFAAFMFLYGYITGSVKGDDKDKDDK